MKSDQEKFKEYLDEVAEALFNDLALYDSSVPKEMRIFYIKRRFNQILNKEGFEK